MKRIFIAAAIIACIAIACNSSTSATSKNADTTSMATNTAKTDMLEKNKQTALASLQGVNDHNADAVYQNATADVTDSGDGNGPAVKGIDSCKAYFKMFLAAFPDIKGENFMAFADGNHVAVVGNWSGTFKGQMMGMKPTGKSFKFRDVDIFTFNDEGKITDHQNVQSMETIMSQIGASMKK